jgi:hypothetical protein
MSDINPNFIKGSLTRVFRAPTVLKDKSEKKFPSFSLLAIEAAWAKAASNVEVTKAESIVSRYVEAHFAASSVPLIWYNW